jgi:sec-independent protein translocase protein TatB
VFEVGFSELLLVAVIGLLVLGPERLPVALRTASIFLGRLRRQYNEIRAEVEREIGADQIRADLHNARVLDELKQSRAALDETRRALETPLATGNPAPTPPPDA